VYSSLWYIHGNNLQPAHSPFACLVLSPTCSLWGWVNDLHKSCTSAACIVPVAADARASSAASPGIPRDADRPESFETASGDAQRVASACGCRTCSLRCAPRCRTLAGASQTRWGCCVHASETSLSWVCVCALLPKVEARICLARIDDDRVVEVGELQHLAGGIGVVCVVEGEIETLLCLEGCHEVAARVLAV
jgi:hypothetical protein